MKRNDRPATRNLTLGVLVLCYSGTIGCRPAISENGDREWASEVSRANDSPDEVIADRIEVPDGEADELFQFMADIESRELGAIDVKVGERIDHVDPDTYSRVIRQIMTARVTACDKILAGEASADSVAQARRMKLEALRLLRDVDPDGLGKQFGAYAAELVSDRDVQVALFAKTSLFQALVADLLSQPDADSEVVAKELRELVNQAGVGEEVFVGARDAVEWLVQSGRISAAAQGFQILADRFKDHENPRMASVATQLAQQAAQLQLMQLVERVVANKEHATEDLLSAMTTKLDTIADDGEALGIGIRLAQSLEFAGEFAVTRQVQELLAQRFGEHENPAVVGDVQRAIELANRRMNLIGKPLQLDGQLLDGEPFDWASYRGRHVIICFWTSWYESWPDQLAAMRRQMDPFRDDGLKVVSINLDNNRNMLERYLISNPLSWPVVVHPDPTTGGYQNPNAIRCGVESVPFVLLVDPQGVVLDIHLMGERLQQSLQRHIGATTPTDIQQTWRGDAELRFVAHLAPQATDTGKPTAHDGQTPDAVLEDPIERINSYAPPAEASAIELVRFILEMQDKPERIQNRNGFSHGVVQAADRVLELETKPRWQTLALKAKLRYLQRDTLLGDEAARASLQEALERWKDDSRPEIAKEVGFLRLEQRAHGADDLPAQELETLLEDLLKFFGEETLGARHLQIASLTVHAVNRIEDVEEREKHFDRLGELFSKSDDKQLSAYGKRIAKPASGGSDHLNTQLELAGVTTDGTVFNWQAYRDRWVVVDFWATWCGPCRRAMPELRELSERFHDQGLEIVGVSLDKDLGALADYLAKEELPWTILAGSDTENLAKKYGVRGIPHLLLVDGEGKIRMVTHRVSDLAERLSDVLGVGEGDEKDEEKPA